MPGRYGNSGWSKEHLARIYPSLVHHALRSFSSPERDAFFGPQADVTQLTKIAA